MYPVTRLIDPTPLLDKLLHHIQIPHIPHHLQIPHRSSDGGDGDTSPLLCARPERERDQNSKPEAVSRRPQHYTTVIRSSLLGDAALRSRWVWGPIETQTIKYKKSADRDRHFGVRHGTRDLVRVWASIGIGVWPAAKSGATAGCITLHDITLHYLALHDVDVGHDLLCGGSRTTVTVHLLLHRECS